MCGIFGLVNSLDSNISSKLSIKIMEKLFLFSESRGSEASGFAFEMNQNINIYKAPFSASELIKTDIFRKSITTLFDNKISNVAVGHSRMVTDGSEYNNDNNQPVMKNKIATIHNGIIVNSSNLWEKYSSEIKTTDLDSEIIPAIFSHHYRNGESFDSSLKAVFEEIYGMTSIAMIFEELENLVLATNNGSLYYMFSNSSNSIIFCSERQIMHDIINTLDINHIFPLVNMSQLKANEALIINTKTLDNQKIRLDRPAKSKTLKDEIIVKRTKDYPLVEIKSKVKYKSEVSSAFSIGQLPPSFETHYAKAVEKISNLRRCTKCILPETFPFIDYNIDGICNYCRNYKPLKTLGGDSLRNFFYESSDNKSNEYDCLIPLSGGRDSSYTLHYVTKELGLKALAFSYDWGMITDLARRNQSRLCGKLGVEHILISADIRKKRANIRKNVKAWLKNPHLGMVPLFMAGDKQYHFFSNKLMDQNSLNFSIMGDNPLETTNFKSGFCGVPPVFGSLKSLTSVGKIRMILFYLKEFLVNPHYINSSFIDTFSAFDSYYVVNHKSINIFDYISWDEEKINNTLELYNWEKARDTDSTWRIGDGTASFYNYIYYIIAGFNENDTFRSNQIREGYLSRDEAMKIIKEENIPRWESLHWYFDTIGVDFFNSINIINKQKKYYD